VKDGKENGKEEREEDEEGKGEEVSYCLQL
jgi:hypothetical protein